MPDSIKLPVTKTDGLQEHLSDYRGRLDGRMYDVKADGITDNATAMANFIAACVSQKCQGVLPTGDIVISTTVDLSSLTINGLKLVGSSFNRLRPGAEGGWATNQIATRIVWGGADGGTMFEFSKAQSIQFENLILAGNTTDSDTVRAGILVLFSSTLGFGMAQAVFRDVGFANYDIAVQFGEVNGDFNCADSYFQNVSFNSKGANASTPAKGVVIKHGQGLNYNFENVEVSGTHHRILVVENGGDIRWRGGAGTLEGESTIIYHRGGGSNAATVVVDGWRFEQHNSWPRLADLAPSGDLVATFRGISDAASGATNPSNPTPGAFLIGPGAKVVVEASSFQRVVAYMTGTSDRYSSLIMRDVIPPGPNTTNNSQEIVTCADAYSRWDLKNSENGYFCRGRFDGSNRHGERPSGNIFPLNELEDGAATSALDEYGATSLTMFGATPFVNDPHSELGRGWAFASDEGAKFADYFLPYVPKVTIQFWMKRTGTVGSGAYVFSVTEEADPTNEFLVLQLNSAGAGQNHMRLKYGATAGSSVDLGASLATEPQLITITLESSTVAKLYLNGVLKSTVTAGVAVSLPTTLGVYYTGDTTRGTFGIDPDGAASFGAVMSIWRPSLFRQLLRTTDMILEVNRYTDLGIVTSGGSGLTHPQILARTLGA